VVSEFSEDLYSAMGLDLGWSGGLRNFQGTVFVNLALGVRLDRSWRLRKGGGTALDFHFPLSKETEAKLQAFARLWLRTMPQPRLALMDPAIVERLGVADDVPVDTALITMRDMINSAWHGHTEVKAEVRGDALDRVMSFDEDPDVLVWTDAFEAVYGSHRYALCEQCGVAFSYRRKGAKLCSNACRVRASRGATPAATARKNKA
jgi:hypothetical protein